MNTMLYAHNTVRVSLKGSVNVRLRKI